METIRFRCPSCGDSQSTHRRMLGKTIRCPSCAGQIDLPTAEDYDAKIAAAREERRQRKAAEKAWNSIESSKEQKQKSAPKKTVAPLVMEKSEIETLKLSKRSREDAEMDMTPMVDVTFLLLIFFMITANFTMQKALQQPAKKDDQATTSVTPEQESETVTIQVDETNSFLIVLPDGGEVPVSSKQGLIVELANAAIDTTVDEDGGGAKLIVDAHPDCMHSSVIDALDAGRESGFVKFTTNMMEDF